MLEIREGKTVPRIKEFGKTDLDKSLFKKPCHVQSWRSGLNGGAVGICFVRIEQAADQHVSYLRLKWIF
jgi:hypothetical protein